MFRGTLKVLLLIRGKQMGMCLDFKQTVDNCRRDSLGKKDI